jgi:hypothetical protein
MTWVAGFAAAVSLGFAYASWRAAQDVVSQRDTLPYAGLSIVFGLLAVWMASS